MGTMPEITREGGGGLLKIIKIKKILTVCKESEVTG